MTGNEVGRGSLSREMIAHPGALSVSGESVSGVLIIRTPGWLTFSDIKDAMAIVVACDNVTIDGQGQTFYSKHGSPKHGIVVLPFSKIFNLYNLNVHGFPGYGLWLQKGACQVHVSNVAFRRRGASLDGACICVGAQVKDVLLENVQTEM